MTTELLERNLMIFQAAGLEGERHRVLHKFRVRFQRSVQNCVRRGFSVEESFGVIWEETLEEIRLSEIEQARLYEELIEWAKAAFRMRAIQNPA